jgi:hypothetical protein
MENKNYCGFVIFSLHNKGSKSEHFAPDLIIGKNETIPLYFKGDNPFENETLCPFHLKYCEIKGAFFSKRNVLEISEIKEIPDPYITYLTQNEGEPDNE